MSTTFTLTATDEIVIEECIECGTKFGMTKTLHTWKKDNKKTFYCPNGHQMAYTKNEADRLRDIIAEKDKSLIYFRRIEQERIEAFRKKQEENKKRRDAKKATK